jgi:phosphoglycolate phosphatase-like HAD superfamily hydrolase
VVDAAVIFDVDGVLLELTQPEEDCFFRAFETLHGLIGLSRDWDSYRVRNDDDIIVEILSRHLGRVPSEVECAQIRHTYLTELTRLSHPPAEVPGARDLVEGLAGNKAKLGVATANLLAAARSRLERTELWSLISGHAFGGDGGGHKRTILARAIASTGLKPHRIAYVGDNRNDVAAGLDNGVYFVGFARHAAQRRRLVAAGARIVTSDHRDTLIAIRQILG